MVENIEYKITNVNGKKYFQTEQDVKDFIASGVVPNDGGDSFKVEKLRITNHRYKAKFDGASDESKLTLLKRMLEVIKHQPNKYPKTFCKDISWFMLGQSPEVIKLWELYLKEGVDEVLAPYDEKPAMKLWEYKDIDHSKVLTDWLEWLISNFKDLDLDFIKAHANYQPSIGYGLKLATVNNSNVYITLRSDNVLFSNSSTVGRNVSDRGVTQLTDKDVDTILKRSKKNVKV